MTTVTTYHNREEWIANRMGLGGSDSGAVCGFGFKSPLELWQEKTGRKQPTDLSDNERVSFGNAVEEPMRALYRVMFPQYQLDFTPYTILRRDDTYSFMFYTPDGWLTERDTGRKGLWECKSATCLKREDWEKWRDKIPLGYLTQLLHGMFVGGFEYADLFAILVNKDNDAEIRRYHVELIDHEADLVWLIQRETDFWRCVETGTNPGATLRF